MSADELAASIAAKMRADEGTGVEIKEARLGYARIQCHPELVSGSIFEHPRPSSNWMLKQVQHDGV